MKMFFERKVLPFILIFQMIIPQNLVFASINNDAEKEIPLEENLPEEANESIEELEEVEKPDDKIVEENSNKEEVEEDEDIDISNGGVLEKRSFVYGNEGSKSGSTIEPPVNPSFEEWEEYIEELIAADREKPELIKIPMKDSDTNINSAKRLFYFRKMKDGKFKNDLKNKIEESEPIYLQIPHNTDYWKVFFQAQFFEDVLDNKNGNVTLIFPHNAIFGDDYNNLSKMHSVQNVIIPNNGNTKLINKEMFKDNEGLTKLRIPSHINKISDNSFEGCKNITNIGSEATIESIGLEAFKGCEKLEAINMASENVAIRAGAFENCKSFKGVLDGDGKINPLKINQDRIEANTFKDCKSLEQINLQDTVETIGESAFENCTSLEDINLLNINTLEKEAFKGCEKLKTISMASEHISIGAGAFENCKSFKGVLEPDKNINPLKINQDRIGANTFKNCEALEEINLQDTVETIGESAFENCTSLEDINLLNINTLEKEAFKGCEKLETISMVSERISIGAGAFENCTSFKGVLEVDGKINPLKINQDRIGANTFKNCEALEEINLHDRVEIIGSGAFENCKSLKDINLLNINKLENNAFKGCSNINGNLIIPGGLDRIDSDALSDLGIVRYISLGKAFNSNWNKNAFKNTYNEDKDYVGYPGMERNIKGKNGLRWAGTFVEPKEDFIEIEEEGKGRLILKNNLDESLESTIVEINGDILPEAIRKELKKSNFSSNECELDLDGVDFNKLNVESSLDVKITSKLETGEKLDEYTINVKVLPKYSEKWNDVKPNLPASWFRYRDSKLNDSRSIDYTKELEIIDFVPPQDFIDHMKSYGKTEVVFPKSYTTKISLEKTGDVGEVKENENGTKIVGIGDNTGIGFKVFEDVEIKLEDNIEYIGQNAFKDSKGIKKIEMEDSVKEIRAGAFDGCISLDEIKLSNEIDKIPDRMLRNCQKIRSIDLPSKVSEIGDYAFENCRNLKKLNNIDSSFFRNILSTEVNLPESIEKIGKGSFKNCHGLSGKLVLRNTMNSIGDEAFLGCININGLSSEIVSGKEEDRIQNIGEESFASCKGLKNIDISNIGTIGKKAFENCEAELIEVKLGDNIKTIEEEAFKNNPNLRKVTIGKDVKIIGDGAFVESDINSLVFEGGENSSLESIGAEAFRDSKKLSGELKIPHKVKKIGEEAFKNCSNVEKINLNEKLEVIGKEAFRNMTSLRNDVVIYEQLEEVGEYVFPDNENEIIVFRRFGEFDRWDVNSLKRSNGKERKVIIFEDTREKVENLEGVLIANFIEPLESRIEVKENGEATLVIKKNVEKEFFESMEWKISSDNKKIFKKEQVKEGAIHLEQDIEKIEIPLKIEYTELGKGKNGEIKDVIKIEFENDMKKFHYSNQNPDRPEFEIEIVRAYSDDEIDNIIDTGEIPASWFHYRELEGDKKLEIIDFLPSPKYIERAREKTEVNFKIPKKLEKENETFDIVGLADSESNDEGYFKEFTNLNINLIVEENIEYIGKNVFRVKDNTTDLNKAIVKVNLKKADNLVRIGDGSFANNRFIENVDFSENTDNLRIIGNEAFLNSENISTIEFKNSITEIGEGAFKNCKNLSGKVVLPEKLERLGKEAFFNCEKIEELDTKNLKIVAEGAFEGTKNIKKVTFGEELTRIEKKAFKDSESLEEIKFPNKLTDIGESAFEGNSSLNKIEFGDNLRTIGSKAFDGYNPSQKIVLPENIGKIGSQAFHNNNDGSQEYIILRHVNKEGFKEWDKTSFNESASIDENKPRILRTYDKYSSDFKNINGQEENFITSNKEEVFYVRENEKTNINLKNHVPEYLESLEWTIDNDKNGDILLNGDESFSSGELDNSELQYGELTVSPKLNYHKIPLERDLVISLKTSVNGKEDNYDLTVKIGTENEGSIVDGTLSSEFFKYEFVGEDKAEIIGFTPNKDFREEMQNKDITFKIPKVVKTIENNEEVTRDIVGIGNIREDMNFKELTNATVIFQDNIEYISDNAFKESKLKAIKFEGDFTSSGITIGNSSFEECENLSEVSINGVKEIGNSAFKGNLKIEDLEIGEQVETIGESAFEGCTNINIKLTIPSKTKSIGNSAFENCQAITGLTIDTTGESLTIGSKAFKNCKGIVNDLKLPERVATIGESAFENVEKTPLIEMQKGPEKIEKNVFKNCKSVREVTIGENTRRIEEGAFEGLEKLEELNLGSKIETIGKRAFHGAKNYKGNLILPENVESIGESAFEGMKLIEKLVLNDNLRNIDNKAFYNCGYGSKVVIPREILSIGENAFANNDDIKPEFILLENTQINKYKPSSFVGNKAGKIVRIYENIRNTVNINGKKENFITASSDRILVGKDGLAKVELNNHLGNKNIEDSLNGKGQLTSFKWEVRYEDNKDLLKNNETVSGELTENLESDILEFGIPVDYHRIPKETELKIHLVTRVDDFPDEYDVKVKIGTNNDDEKENWLEEVPESFFKYRYLEDNKAEIIGFVPSDKFIEFIENAELNNKEFNFRIPKETINKENGIEVTRDIVGIGNVRDDMNFKELINARIIFQDNIEYINDNAFKESKLKVVEFDGDFNQHGVKIGTSAFENCENLSEVSINGVKEIGNSAFKNNSTLLTLNLGEKIEKIGDSAFEGCTNITSSISFPRNTKFIGNSAFKNCSNIKSINLNQSSLESLGESAFEACEAIYGKVTIPSSLKVISKNAFKGCSSIEELDVGKSVGTIGVGAFEDCEGLKEVDLKNTIRIEDNAFKNVKSLESIEFPNIEYIGKSSFENVSGIKGNLELPVGLTDLGDSAFKGCTGLYSVSLNKNLQNIGAEAFKDCKNISGSLVIPGGVRRIGANSFEGSNTNLYFNILKKHGDFNQWDKNAFGGSTKEKAKLRLFSKQKDKAEKYFTNIEPNTFIDIYEKEAGINVGIDGTGKLKLIDNLKDPMLEKIEWSIKSDLLKNGEESGVIKPEDIDKKGLINITLNFDLSELLEEKDFKINLDLKTSLIDNENQEEYTDENTIVNIKVNSFLETIKEELKELEEKIEEKLDNRKVPMEESVSNEVSDKLDDMNDIIVGLEELVKTESETITNSRDKYNELKGRFVCNQDTEKNINLFGLRDSITIDNIKEELEEVSSKEQLTDGDKSKLQVYLLDKSSNIFIGKDQDELDKEIKEVENKIPVDDKDKEELDEKIKKIDDKIKEIEDLAEIKGLTYKINEKYIKKQNEFKDRIKGLTLEAYKDKIEKMILGLNINSESKDIENIKNGIDDTFESATKEDLVKLLNNRISEIIKENQEEITKFINSEDIKTIEDRSKNISILDKLNMFIEKYEEFTDDDSFENEQEELREKIKSVEVKEYTDLLKEIKNISIDTSLEDIRSIKNRISNTGFYDSEKANLEKALMDTQEIILHSFVEEITKKHEGIDKKITSNDISDINPITSSLKKELLETLGDIDGLIERYEEYLKDLNKIDENIEDSDSYYKDKLMEIKKNQQAYKEYIEGLSTKEYLEILSTILGMQANKNVEYIENISKKIDNSLEDETITKEEGSNLKDELIDSLFKLIEDEQKALLEKIERYKETGGTSNEIRSVRIELDGIAEFIKVYRSLVSIIDQGLIDLNDMQTTISNEIDNIPSIDKLILDIEENILGLREKELKDLGISASDIVDKLEKALIPEESKKDLGKLLEEELYESLKKKQENIYNDLEGKDEVIQELYDKYLKSYTILEDISKLYGDLENRIDIEKDIEKDKEIKENQEKIKELIDGLKVVKNENYRKLYEDIENLYSKLYGEDGLVEIEKLLEIGLQEVYEIENRIYSDRNIVDSEKKELYKILTDKLDNIIVDLQEYMKEDIDSKKAKPVSKETYKNLNLELNKIDQLVKEHRRLEVRYVGIDAVRNMIIIQVQSELYKSLNSLEVELDSLTKDEIKGEIDKLESPIKDFDLDVIISEIDNLEEDDMFELGQYLVKRIYEDIESRQFKLRTDIRIIKKPAKLIEKQGLLDRLNKIQKVVDRHRLLEIKYKVSKSQNSNLQKAQSILKDSILAIKVESNNNLTYKDYIEKIDKAETLEELDMLLEEISKDSSLTLEEKDNLVDYLLNKKNEMSSEDGISVYDGFVKEINDANTIEELDNLIFDISWSDLQDISKNNLYKLIDEKRLNIYESLLDEIVDFEELDDFVEKIEKDVNLKEIYKYILEDKISQKEEELRKLLVDDYDRKINATDNKNELKRLKREVEENEYLEVIDKNYLYELIDSKIEKLDNIDSLGNAIDELPNNSTIKDIEDIEKEIEKLPVAEREDLLSDLKDRVKNIISERQEALEKDINEAKDHIENLTDVKLNNLEVELQSIDKLLSKYSSDSDFSILRLKQKGLEKSLKELASSYEEYKKEKEAEAKVKQAETSKKQEDIDSARELVNKLKNESLKKELNSRLDKVQEEIGIEEIVEQLENAIDELPNNLTIKDMEDIEKEIEKLPEAEREDLLNKLKEKVKNIISKRQEDLEKNINKAKDDIENLTDTKFNNLEVELQSIDKLLSKYSSDSDFSILRSKQGELEKSLKELASSYEEYKKEKEAEAEAEAKVKQAETSKKQEDIESARELVNKLKNESLKKELNSRLDKVQEEINGGSTENPEEPGKPTNPEKPSKDDVEDDINKLPENPSIDEIEDIENNIDGNNNLTDEDKESLLNKLSDKLADIIIRRQEVVSEKIKEVKENLKELEHIELKKQLEKIEKELSEIDKLLNKYNKLNGINVYRKSIEENDLNDNQDKLKEEANELKSIESVWTAETSKKQKDVDNARELVNKLKNESLKKELNTRLDKLQEEIGIEEIVEQLENAIDELPNNSTIKDIEDIEKEIEKLPVDEREDLLNKLKDRVKNIISERQEALEKDINEAKNRIENLTDVKLNNLEVELQSIDKLLSKYSSDSDFSILRSKQGELTKSLEELASSYEEYKKEKEAEAKVKQAETSKKQEDIDSARELVNKLKNESLKKELNSRLDKLQEEIDESEEPGTDPEKPGDGGSTEKPVDPEKPSKEDIEGDINTLPENPSIDEIKDIEDNIDGNDNLTDKDKEMLGGKLRDKLGEEIRDKQDSMLEEIDECDGVATEEKKEELKLELANISEKISKHRELEEKYGVGYIQNDILKISQKIIELSIEGLELPDTEKPEEPDEDEEQSNKEEVEKVEEMINSIGNNLSEETIDSIKEVISNNQEILEKDKIKLYGQLRDKLGEEIRLKQKDLLNEVKSYKGIANENQQEDLMRKLESISTLILKHKELEEEYGVGYIINDVLELSQEVISMYIQGLTPEKEDPGTDPEKPGDGGSTEKPGDGGSTEKPGDGGSTEKPGDGGSTEKPGDGGSTEKPGDGGSTEKPGDGGSTEKPGDGGSTEKPGDGGSTEKPENGGSSINIGNIIDSNKKISKAYLKGYSDGTIRPEAKITREEVTAMVYRALNRQGFGYHEFKDIEQGRWSEKYIAKLYSQGIIEGFDGKFRPTDNMTRGEFATLMARALGLKEIKLNKFKDIKGHWAEGYINAVAKAGYIEGYENGNFRPDDSITRAEVVVILNRVIYISVDITSVDENANIYKDLLKDKWYYADMLVASIDHEYKLVNGKHVWIKNSQNNKK